MHSTDGDDRFLRLRPGGEVYGLSSDELQIAFPNYTATFTSPAVTKGVAAIIRAIGSGERRDQVIRQVVEVTTLEEAFVAYLIDAMMTAQCLAVGAHQTRAGPLHDFYAYLGADTASVGARIQGARCVLVRLAGDAAPPEEALNDAGLHVELIEAEPGGSSTPALLQLEQALASATLVGCWNVPYRSPFARIVNELAIREDVPVLFGACEGVVGRVGPLVLAGNTACLDCVVTRLLTHAGGPELRAYREYRLRNEESVPRPWPVHGVFARGIAGLFGVELLQMALGSPSPAIGGFVEYRFGEFGSERHSALRVPTCAACRPQAPRRLAWDARFPAPIVKRAAQ